MHWRTKNIFFGSLLGAFANLTAIADECPALPEIGEANGDTRKCLSMLEEQFAGYSPDIEILSERNALLAAYEYADNKLVIATFFVRYCGLLSDPRWQLSAEERATRLNLAQEQLNKKAQGMVPIVHSRNISHHSQDPRTFWITDYGDRWASPQFAVFGDTPAADPAEGSVAEPPPETEYLRDVPYYITKANRNFVMVASVGSAEEAFATVRRFKEKAPQFDFVAYAPYDEEKPSYAIMMATWVSWSVAKRALADAREHVAPDAIIWSCRGLGDRC